MQQRHARSAPGPSPRLLHAAYPRSANFWRPRQRLAKAGGGSDLLDGLFHGARIAFIIGGILATITVACAPVITAPMRTEVIVSHEAA